MTNKVIGETPITISELKSELEKIKKRDETLGFRGEKSEEYLNHFAKLDASKAKELFKKIDELGVARLKAEYIVKVIDMLPKTIEEMKLIFQSQPLSLTKEDMQKILDVVKEYVE